jgi:hypothetical protein
VRIEMQIKAQILAAIVGEVGELVVGEGGPE